LRSCGLCNTLLARLKSIKKKYIKNLSRLKERERERERESKRRAHRRRP